MSSPPLPVIVSDAALARIGVAGLVGADELDVEEEDVAELRAAARRRRPCAGRRSASRRRASGRWIRALSPAITSSSPAVPSPLSPTITSFASRSVSPRRGRIERAVTVRVEDAGRGRAAAGDVVLAEVAVDRVGAAVALDVVVRAGVAADARRGRRRRLIVSFAALAEEDDPRWPRR